MSAVKPLIKTLRVVTYGKNLILHNVLFHKKVEISVFLFSKTLQQHYIALS